MLKIERAAKRDWGALSGGPLRFQLKFEKTTCCSHSKPKYVANRPINQIINKFGHIRRIKRLVVNADVLPLAIFAHYCHGAQRGAYCEAFDAPNAPKLICNLVYMSVGKLLWFGVMLTRIF